MARGLSVAEASTRIERSCSLADDVTRLRFVNGPRGAALARLGIERVRDLLLHVPRRYLDFTDVVKVAYADVGSDATVVVRIDRVQLKRPRPRLQIVELYVQDETGVMRVSFFGQPWLSEQLHPGDTVALSGKVTFSYGFKEMKSPFHEVVSSEGQESPYARLLPVHAVGEGITASWMRRIMSAALADVGDVCDYLPAELLAEHGLMSLGAALRSVQFPVSLEEKEVARRRLAYDELLCLQLALLARQHVEIGPAQGFAHITDGPHERALMAALPFALTDEQRVAAEEIKGDMRSARVMNRLLLGDVGTGKTAVAAVALAVCADTGSQAAMMAPTSVLARQYAERLGPLLDNAGVSWVLVTGSTSAEDRRLATASLAEGSTCVAFGTTALLSDDVSFQRLSLVIIDEQHRFGVDQRAALRRKGAGADQLTMSATPIPRTLALSVYGDVACSRIRTRPRAGAGIVTEALGPESLDKAYGAIREAVRAGQQAYVICPLVDDVDDGSELDDIPESVRSKSDRLRSATSTAQELARSVFPDLSIGLLTGRLSAAEKDEVMSRFRSGELDVLVATTVVEVGVDVPNATVMLVHDADRFGLATLHQLRGRVGRGDIAGRVFLSCAARRGTPARQRLDALVSTSDGFELAELDLRLRHEGEVLGYRQHGGVTLTLCDLATDGDLVEWAHQDARRIDDEDPSLSLPLHRPLATEMVDRFGAYFAEVGRL